MTEFVDAAVNGRWPMRLLPTQIHVSTPHWERERLASMRDHLRPGDLVVDVGGESGDYPALWATWGCRVVIIEPHPAYWPDIRATWEANTGGAPAGCYVGFASDVTDPSADGRMPGATGAAVEDDGWPAASRGPLRDGVGFAHLAEQAESIPQTRLDDLLAGTRVDAITVDTEGSELRVLRGAERLLREDRPQVWVSVHLDRPWMDALYGGVGREDVDAFMAGLDYGAEPLGVDHEEHVRYYPLEAA